MPDAIRDTQSASALFRVAFRRVLSYGQRSFGVSVREVLVREQRQRWAGCDAVGQLRFNWRIIQAPMSLVDCVVAYELIHRLHKDHTPRLWATLGQVMSDYEWRKEHLRVLWARLSW